MSIANSSQPSIRGRNAFNHVHGNQVNQTVSGGVVHVHGTPTQVIERTMSDEFEYVKRGHIVGVEDLGSVDLSEWEWYWQNGKLFGRLRKSARKTVSTVNVHPDRQSKFTVFEYEGDDAHEVWQDDFQQFSRVSRIGSFQLFGINRSEVPMLIFYHELIPVAHFFTGTLWMNLYIAHLSESKGCRWYSLWLDTSSGSLCDGPAGPNFFLRFPSLKEEDNIQDIPSTLDMLEEKASLRFFSRLGANMDYHLLQCVTWFSKTTYFGDLRRYPSHYLPIDINDGLRFDTVYSSLLEPVARWSEAPRLWKWVGMDGLVEETCLDGGLTRRLTDVRRVFLGIKFDWEAFCNSWLSQSSCVFDALEAIEHQESFFMVHPEWLSLRYTPHEYDTYNRLSANFNICDAAEGIPAVYLFLYPPPMTLSELASWMGGHTHFWSFDPTGQSRIPAVEWERWDLPVLVPHPGLGYLRSWPTHVYTTLRDWQTARGFDPSTSDWAQHVGCPKFEIIGAEKKEDRFEELFQHKQGSETVKYVPEVVQVPVNQPESKPQLHHLPEPKVPQEKSNLGRLVSVWIIIVSVQLMCIICLVYLCGR